MIDRVEELKREIEPIMAEIREHQRNQTDKIASWGYEDGMLFCADDILELINNSKELGILSERERIIKMIDDKINKLSGPQGQSMDSQWRNKNKVEELNNLKAEILGDTK